ncbi:hypothetical protein B0J12DRAFT_45862 [Macrophomina phaseolina]|uniref:Nudix hydrolase domain-containing protein n=1 Tax=Macrophomina phaseolina TaxID=35725 RepID=A0ABQ8GDU9_9PEZI|nr:hypothetical protein B0J12DRAFT_45862 [Macrophomina phaseolina]
MDGGFPAAAPPDDEWPRPQNIGRSNLELINDCDNFPHFDLDTDLYTETLQGLYTLHVADHHAVLGYVRPHVAETLQGLPAWDVSPESRTLILLAGVTEPERTAILAQTASAMRATRHFADLNAWRDELYPVYGRGGELLFKLERAACPLFGILVCSVSLTCYVKDESAGYRFWVSRRKRSKAAYSGMLDTTVAGGLRADERPLDALARDAEVEASLPPALVREKARPAGNVSFFHVRDERAGGEPELLQPGSQYVYDLELEQGRQLAPRPDDVEMDDLALLSTKEVQAALARGEFKPAAALAFLDFFVRHGILTSDNEMDYTEVVSRLHRRLPLPEPRLLPPKKAE